MKTFLVINSPTGQYLLKNHFRCDVIEQPVLAPFNLPRLATVLAETEDAVVSKLNLAQYVTPAPITLENKIKLGEAHVEKSGFTGARLVTLMDLLLTVREAGTTAEHPKLIALYTWLQTVKATAIAGSTTFDPAPFTFEEVVTE